MQRETMLEVYSDPTQYKFRLTIGDDSREIDVSAEGLSRGDDFFRINSGELYVSIPTTELALERFRGVVRVVRRLRTSLFARCEVVSVGVSSIESGYVGSFDALMWRSAVGTTLEEYLSVGVNRCDVGMVFGYYTLFERTIRECGVGVDLSPSALVVDVEGYIYPIYLDTIRMDNIAVESDLKILRQAVENGCDRTMSSSATSRVGGYEPFEEQCWGDYIVCGYPCEGRVRVRNMAGRYGFVDESGCEVIKLKYRSAEDFRESRSVVEGDNGWGVINLYGEEVIPTQYESVGYNDITGVISVRYQGLWGYFSLNGDQLTPINLSYPEE